MISAVIPVHNEEERIGSVLEETQPYVDEIIVVDDASDDDSAEVANGYAEVKRNSENRGYIGSIKRGIDAAEGDIIVTLDADGEHEPSYIPELVKPIREGQADLVFGRREKIPRPSERIISFLVRKRVGAEDTGTGFRAIRSKLAKELELDGYCTCGIFSLEAKSKGAKIEEIDAPMRDIDKPKGIAWRHLRQLFLVLKRILFGF